MAKANLPLISILVGKNKFQQAALCRYRPADGVVRVRSALRSSTATTWANATRPSDADSGPANRWGGAEKKHTEHPAPCTTPTFFGTLRTFIRWFAFRLRMRTRGRSARVLWMTISYSHVQYTVCAECENTHTVLCWAEPTEQNNCHYDYTTTTHAQ